MNAAVGIEWVVDAAGCDAAALRDAATMIRQTVGFLSRAARQRVAAASDGLFFAHSDVSGLSLFEEAHEGGVRAADSAFLSL